MRVIAQSVVLLAWACGQLTGQDAHEIIRRAVEQDQRNSKISRNYTYLQRQEVRELDHSGKVKKRTIDMWDVTLLEGSPYKRLVGRNDLPLSTEDQKFEEEKLRRSNEERRKETSEARAQRLADWQRRMDRQREPVKELPDAFDFTLLREEKIGGRPVYRIDALPKAGYKPKSSFAEFFPKVKLKLWIDQSDYQAARIEMEVLDTISFGGFLVRLSKGTRLMIEQARVDDVWLPKEVSLNASARILLLKGLNREMDLLFSDYKRFQVDSHIVAIAP